MGQIPNEPLRIEVLADERTIVLDGELDMADTETLTRAVTSLTACTCRFGFLQRQSLAGKPGRGSD